MEGGACMAEERHGRSGLRGRGIHGGSVHDGKGHAWWRGYAWKGVCVVGA